MNKIYEKLQDCVEEGDEEEILDLVQEALDDGETPVDIINEGLVAGMNIVGEQFADQELFVPDVLLSAKAMEEGMKILEPLLNEGDVKKKGTIVFCTCAGDLHDIGKKLCVMLLQSAGYDVHDLGVDVGVDQIITAVKEYKPNIVAMSAMLTTTMVTMDEAVASLKENNLFDKCKVMVGGAPVSSDYAGNIDANYSEDAIEAVKLADKLLA